MTVCGVALEKHRGCRDIRLLTWGLGAFALRASNLFPPFGEVVRRRPAPDLTVEHHGFPPPAHGAAGVASHRFVEGLRGLVILKRVQEGEAPRDERLNLWCGGRGKRDR